MAKRKGYTPKPRQEVAETPEEVKQAAPSTKTNRLPYFIVFALGFLLYANTIPFDYALDDKLYITANEFTKKGLEGISEIWTNDLMTGFFGAKKNLVEGGRYRPLALTTHAIEWEFFKEAPSISHFINVVLYGLIGVVMLSVLKSVFSWREERWWMTLPFLATVFFLAHPIHTEVAANIKSRDEIMSLLFALMAFRAAIRFVDSKHAREALLSGVWFLASLFSKESSVTFLGVIPLTFVFFTSLNVKEILKAMAPVLTATAIYLLIRLSVFGDQGASLEVAEELMNKPYLRATESERLASIFFTMGLYVKLLFWPHPLTHDYYPFHPFRTYAEIEAGISPYLDWSDARTVLSVVIYAALIGFGIWALIKRLRGGSPSVPGYAALFYFGTFILFSNLFFDIGAFMNERFVFIPSLGFTIFTAWVVLEWIEKRFGNKVAQASVLVILLAYSGKTIARNFAWENDRALALADIATSDGSAKVKMTMGSELLDLAREEANEAEKQRILKEAEQAEIQSLKIHPTYFPPLDLLGNIYFEMGQYEYSIHYFAQAIKVRRNDDRLLTNLEAVGNVATQKRDFASANKAYRLLTKHRQGAALSRIYSALGELHGKNLNDLKASKGYLLKALEADPNNASAYQKIGIVYAMTNQADSALFHFNRSLELEPENARVLLNLGILYRNLGDAEKGNAYIQRAVEIDPSVQGNAN